MNVIDRVILSLSPARGLARIKAKSAASALMNYDAASKGRRTYGWKAPGTDADGAASASRSRLRNLSRDMVRNRSLAVRGREVVSGNVVGTGIMPSVQMATRPDGDEKKAEDASALAMDVIRDHLLTPAIDTHGVQALPGLQGQVMNAVFTDGEVLVRRRARNLDYDTHLRLPFQVQLMEVDHLDETLTSHGKNEVVEGIEYNSFGQAVAYHLMDVHPGSQTNWRARKYDVSRVPAQNILHIRRAERPGQMRGIPWLAPVMMTLGELSDYQEAQILKQRVAALLAFFVEASDDADAYDGKAIEEIAPGAVVGLKPGQKVVPSQPPTVEGYEGFMREGIRTIATGLGLTYESFGDLTGVNFSSGRMGRMEMDRFIQMWQQQIMIAQFCNGIARWTLDAWRLNRKLPTAPKALEWTAPRRPLIDPGKEVIAAAKEIEAGLTSLQRKQREMGYDPEIIARERAEDAARGATPEAAAPPKL